MTIGTLDVNAPNPATDPAGLGAAEIKAFKATVRASFPNFITTGGADICTLTGPQIADAARKSAPATIAGLWNFTTRPTFNASPLLAATDAPLGQGAMFRLNTGTLAGAGLPVPVNYASGAISGGMARSLASGIFTIADAGTYLLEYTCAYGSTTGATFALEQVLPTPLTLASLNVPNPGLSDGPVTVRALAALAAGATVRATINVAVNYVLTNSTFSIRRVE